MDVGRRDFLKIIGLGTTATVASGCSFQGIGDALQLSDPEIKPEPGLENWVTSSCGLCSAGCGTLVRKIGQRIVKVEGNPLHPVNRGKLCPVGQASLQLLYNPDRVRSPLKRVGERGSGQWQKITWKEAIAIMASKIKELRERGEAHTIVALGSQSSELTDLLAQRFLSACGSPNFISVRPENGSSTAQYITQGIKGRVAYDLENTKYILSFGTPIVEGWLSPARQMRAVSRLHQGLPGYRGKLVQIESRFSPTAAKADEWVPIRPQTEGILALGIAGVLVKEDLYDDAFAQRYLHGFEGGFKTTVLEKYPLKKVSEITGVPAETIERVAHEFAHYSPSIALAGIDLSRPANGQFSAVAIQALNGLVGNIDKPGGVLVRPDPPLSSWQPVKQDQVAANGLQKPALQLDSVDGLTDIIVKGKPYKVKALFDLGSNPLFSAPAAFRDAIRKVPFIVSFSLFLDETAQEADLVLPDCTSFERWDVQTEMPGFTVAAVGVGNPALNPLYESRPASEVVLDLARQLNGEIGASFPWKDSSEAIQALMMGLYHAKRGVVFTSEFQDEHLRSSFREWDWAPQEYRSFEDFWKDLTEKGGWADPYYKYQDYGRTLKTSSGKFELPSLLTEKPVADKGDQSHPFYLYLFSPLAFVNPVSANLPFLQEIAGAAIHSPWDSWVEINPKTAKQLAIKDGDWVVVESPTNKVKVRARLFPGTMPDVINFPLGQGHTAQGRWAKGRGVNPLSLLSDKGPTKVKISKA